MYDFELEPAEDDFFICFEDDLPIPAPPRETNVSNTPVFLCDQAV